MKQHISIASSVRPRLLRALGALCVLGASTWNKPSLAYDIVEDSIPQRWVQPLVPETLPEQKYPSYFNDVDKARMQVATGRYRLALATLSKATGTNPDDAKFIRAKAYTAIGRYDVAESLLRGGEPTADSLIALTELRIAQGNATEARATAEQLIKLDANSLRGYALLGQSCELTGDLEAATAAYGWFVTDQHFLDKWQGNNGDAAFDDAENVTLIGRAIDRWASLTGAYKDNPALHNALLNIFVKAYDVIDRGFEPAHVAAGEYYLSHDNKDDAAKELETALDANPNDVHALSLMGNLAIDSFNFDMADDIIDQIRKVDRSSAVADLLETRTLLQQRRPQDAFAPVQRVLKRQPKNLEALGLLAGAYSLRLENDKAGDVLKQVEAIDPNNATAYCEVAEQLGAMRQYPRAAEKYKIAIERAAWWTAPRNGLGLLYTQSGDEDDARVTLDAAHTLDPFNMSTTNYLRLLDDLAKFARSETDHFVVMYDAQADPIIPEYFGEYLETIYKDVCGDFKHEPAVKTYIEVFPTHDAFSVRTTGSPWIGTVGASTGRVIAMVAPRKGKLTMGSFNWAKVLRHEFTHTVTLAATDNRISHWMTEGLAVLEEQSPLQWDWVPMLNSAVKKKSLFTIDNLTWAFVRPRKPSDRQLAYAESFWICEYIDKTYGRDHILQMLEQFKLGRSAEETFEKVLGKSTTQFQTEFFAWCDKQVASWGYDDETTQKAKPLVAKGDELMKAGKFTEAMPVWEQLNKLRPMDQTPHMRLASIYLKLNRPDDAAKQLEALESVELKDNRYSKAIARIYRDAGSPDKAVKYAKRAVYIDPYDDAGHELLAGLYEKTNNQTGLSREKRVLNVLVEWRELQSLHGFPAEPNADTTQPSSTPSP